MPGLKPVAGLRVVLAGACAITWISAARPVIAQYRCATESTTCTVNPAPAGTPCRCSTPSGMEQGFVLSRGNRETSTNCETEYGRCHIDRSPVGSPCECGADPGTVQKSE
jgi:hypothetical protein